MSLIRRDVAIAPLAQCQDLLDANMTTVDLRTDFFNLQPRLIRLQSVMKEQIAHLVDSSGLTLGVPIESRLKTWDSFDEKLKRKGLAPKSLSEIEDLLGLRVIFLFQRDLEQFISNFAGVFEVHSQEDTASRLSASEFGYKSQHFIVSVPSSWATTPTMADLPGLKVEVQIRTLSQHIWAAASHKLQYKHEDGVPEPIKRTINRVSALLELVDLELARVLNDRQSYAVAQVTHSNSTDQLDVSVVEAVLDAELPHENKDIFGESYADLLHDLLKCSILTRGQLQDLLRNNKDGILRADKNHAQDSFFDDGSEQGEGLETRKARGVYFTHVGLAREALNQQFGEISFRKQYSELT